MVLYWNNKCRFYILRGALLGKVIITRLPTFTSLYTAIYIRIFGNDNIFLEL
jgi:hypothetical protein